MKEGANDELIQKFLDGKLDSEGLREFEKEMEKNPELDKEVKGLQEIELGLRSAGVDKFKTEVKAWETEYQDSQSGNETKVRSLSVYFSIAASVAVLLVAGIYFMSSRTVDYQTLYADNFTPYEDMVLVRGEGDEALSSGMTAYNAQQYELAIQKLTSYVDQFPGHYGVALYIGISQMELNNYSDALTNFELAQKDPMFKQQAQWYQALLFIKSEQLDKAKAALQGIIDLEGHYKKEAAKELLGRLE